MAQRDLDYELTALSSLFFFFVISNLAGIKREFWLGSKFFFEVQFLVLFVF